MKENRNMGSIKALTILSILVALSGMASAYSDTPNPFYGNVTINGVDAPAGTNISAYIGGELRGSLEIGTAGKYGYDMNCLDVNGNASEDDNAKITFTVCGVTANENATWYAMSESRKLDLSASATPIVSIGSADGNVGESVSVSVNITNAAAIGAMDINITYNASILDATNVANGSMIASLPDILVAHNISAAGLAQINFSFATYPGMINGDGELFVVTFDVVGGDAGDNSTLVLEAEAYTPGDPPQSVAVETVDGVVNVTGVADPITRYDANDNGYIDRDELKTAIYDYLTAPIGTVISRDDLKILIYDYLDNL